MSVEWEVWGGGAFKAWLADRRLDRELSWTLTCSCGGRSCLWVLLVEGAFEGCEWGRGGALGS